MSFRGNRGQWLSWWDGRVRSLLFDLLLAVGLAHPWSVPSEHGWVLSCCGAVLLGLALVVRRRFPWLPALVGATTLFLTPTVGLGVTVGIYTMARRRGPSVLLWITSGLGPVSLAVRGQSHDPPDPFLSFDHITVITVLGTLYAVVPLLLGLWIHSRKALLHSLRDCAEGAERERDLLAERAVTAERRRIAREMHDVVAHRVSVISLQTGGLTMVAPDERTGEVAETIRITSATALSELRGMLRVLRDDETGTSAEQGGELAGAPTAGSFAALVGDSAGAGANIRLDLPETLPETSGEVGRAAYRVVQEALTNAAKHAPHAAAHVDVAADDEHLVVTVSNHRGRSTDTSAVPGSGYGLIGVRERVTLAGGTLRTGPTEDGGYRVRAVFPVCVDEVATA